MSCMAAVFDRSVWNKMTTPHCAACHGQAIKYAKGLLSLVLLPEGLPMPPGIVNLIQTFNDLHYLKCPEYDKRQCRYYLRRYMDNQDYRKAFEFMAKKVNRRRKLTRKQ